MAAIHAPDRDDVARADHAPDDGGDGGADDPTDVSLEGWREVLGGVARAAKEQDLSLAAAGVAYYGFVAAIPALAAAIAIYGIVTTPAQAAANVQDLFAVLPDDARSLLSDQVRSLAGSSSTGLSVTAAVGIVAALWTASSGMAHLAQAVNLAFGEDHTRPFLRHRALALALTLGALALLGIAVGAQAVLPRLAADAPAVGRGAAQLVAWAVAALAFLVGSAALFRWAPEREEPRWVWVSPGALAALVLWFAASLVLQAYVATFGSYGEAYGALAGVVLLLLWLYVSALVLLLAAALDAELERQGGAGPGD
ncbi:MAG: YihY/virulence factor BrkB family protein [Acidimicrobiales bacterium]|nr:YihY/virulence factor BrkB family protein [Acidimicrobiales bacterium]HRW36689.1 YihY/virulence factor BrkB family protein [Aquihabitans sp.]